MINNILIGILKLVISLINLLLTPINLLIETYMPSLDNVLTSFGQALTLCGTYVAWFFDAMCIEATTISLLVLVLIFKLTFPLLINIFKTIINWYDKLKI